MLTLTRQWSTIYPLCKVGDVIHAPTHSGRCWCLQASVSIVIIIALCMFCRCCGQMRSVVQPLGPNLPAGGRLRRRHLNMVRPLLAAPSVCQVACSVSGCVLCGGDDRLSSNQSTSNPSKYPPPHPHPPPPLPVSPSHAFILPGRDCAPCKIVMRLH